MASRHSPNLKLHILQFFQEGQYSIGELCKNFNKATDISSMESNRRSMGGKDCK